MPATTQTAPVMNEDAQTPEAGAAAAPAGAGGQGQNVEVPAAACEGCKAGDTVQFKVVSIDEQGGVANLARVPYGGDEDEHEGGADGMASEFSREKMNQRDAGPKY